MLSCARILWSQLLTFLENSFMRTEWRQAAAVTPDSDGTCGLDRRLICYRSRFLKFLAHRSN